MQPPTFDDVLAARENIAPHIRPTPTYRYSGLSDLLGTDTYVKHENHLPTAAFKVRGGVNLVSQLSYEERRRGVICASTGNHGQSVAFASSIFGVHAIVCAPVNANPVKVAAMRGFGAEIMFYGHDFDAARERCEDLAREHGYRYIHSGDEPHLIAGVGTAYLELLTDFPDIDVVIAPLGGGSGVCGGLLVARALKPSLRFIAVQSAQAPSAYRSWSSRSLIDDETNTYAEGLATRTPFALPQQMLWQMLDEFLLVDDDEIRAAQALMIENTRNLIESAASAPLAAAIRMRAELAGKKVALVATGGNVSPDQLLHILGQRQAATGSA